MKRPTLKFTSAATALITFATYGMGCGSPGENSGNHPSASSPQHQALPGTDLYKGMVFGLGPAAHYFDDLWQRPEIKSKMDSAGLAKREEAAIALMGKIAELDPTFFERFGSDLRSGNHLVIDRLLTEAREVTLAAAESLRAAAGMRGEISASVVAVERETGFWLYVETVVAVVIAVLVVITQIDVTPVMDGPQASALRRDVWVDMLAKKNFDAR